MSSTSRSRSDGVIGRFAAALTVLLLCSQATVTPQSPCPGPTPACPIVCAENAVVTCSGPTPTGVTFHLQFIGAGPGIAAPLGSGGGGGGATCCPCWGILQLQFDSGLTSYHACYTADGGWTWGGTSPGVQRQPVATDCGAIP